MNGASKQPAFESMAQIETLIARFEAGTLPRSEWRHRAHLIVALWYMLHHDEAEATRRTIEGIRAYNRSQQILETTTGGYHETLTLFWLSRTRRFLRTVDSRLPPLELFQAFLRAYGERKELFAEYYSPSRIRSHRARHSWVEPDLRPLD